MDNSRNNKEYLFNKIFDNRYLFNLICIYLNLYEIYMLLFVNKNLNLLVKENIRYIIKKNEYYYFSKNINFSKYCNFLSNQKEYINNLHKLHIYNKEFMIIYKNINKISPKLSDFKKFIKAHCKLDKFRRNINYCNNCHKYNCCWDKNIILRNIFFNSIPQMSLNEYNNYAKTNIY